MYRSTISHLRDIINSNISDEDVRDTALEDVNTLLDEYVKLETDARLKYYGYTSCIDTSSSADPFQLDIEDVFPDCMNPEVDS